SCYIYVAVGLQKWREQKQQQAPTIDEYIRYCDAACTPIVDPRAWWLEQKTTYLALAVMALDILSIPAMEAEPERLFSSAKAAMIDKRNQMKAETLEALESLKSWLGGHSTAWLDSCATATEGHPFLDNVVRRYGVDSRNPALTFSFQQRLGQRQHRVD
ncbi:hypothetical protein V502_02365, partial [Pseudogymnoascus sp. VKM F-4520 (FW-2644)]